MKRSTFFLFCSVILLLLSLQVIADTLQCGPIIIDGADEFGELCDDSEVCVGDGAWIGEDYCCFSPPGCMTELDFDNYLNVRFINDGVDEEIQLYDSFCREEGGEICTVFQECSGEWIYTDDSGGLCCLNGSCIDTYSDEFDAVMYDLDKEETVDLEEDSEKEYFDFRVSINDSDVSKSRFDTVWQILVYPVVFLFLTVFILLALFLFFNGDSRKLNIVRERAHHLKKLGYPHHHVRYYLLKEGHHPKHVDKVLGKDVKK